MAEGTWGEATCWITSSIGLDLSPTGDKERCRGDEGGKDWTGDLGRGTDNGREVWCSSRDGSGCECRTN